MNNLISRLFVFQLAFDSRVSWHDRKTCSETLEWCTIIDWVVLNHGLDLSGECVGIWLKMLVFMKPNMNSASSLHPIDWIEHASHNSFVFLHVKTVFISLSLYLRRPTNLPPHRLPNPDVQRRSPVARCTVSTRVYFSPRNPCGPSMSTSARFMAYRMTFVRWDAGSGVLDF